MSKKAVTAKTVEPTPVILGEAVSIPVSLLVASPHNKRSWYGNDRDDPDLCALRDSIESTGGNIQRVVVRRLGDQYEIICGERRVRAIRMSTRITAVNCELCDLTDEQAFEFCMAENARRKNLQPIEEADTAAAWMQARPAWTLDELAAHMGISRQTAARRLSLASLTPDWRESAADAGHWASRWGAGHLERIAALPPDTQNRLLDTLTHEGGNANWMRDMTLSRLNGTIGRLCRTLDAVPWALDSGDHPCTQCPKRSGCQPELWDNADLEADPDYDDDEFNEGEEEEMEQHDAAAVRETRSDTCLDGECFDTKLTAAQQASVAGLRDKHPDLVIIMEWNDEPAPWMGATAKRYDLSPCKKKDAGAVPTIRLADLAGGVKWMMPDSPAAERRVAAAAEKNQTPEQALAAKRKNLDKLRWKLACSLIECDLDAMCKKPKTLPELTRAQMLALAHIGGTNNRHATSNITDAKFWKDVENAADDEDKTLDALFCAAASEIRSRLHSLQSFTDGPFKHEAHQVCLFFCMNVNTYWDAACAEKREPKSWAKAATGSAK